MRKIERPVTEHVSHFDRRDANRAVADNFPHGAPAQVVERLADEFLASGSVIRIAETRVARASPRSGSGSWSAGR